MTDVSALTPEHVGSLIRDVPPRAPQLDRETVNRILETTGRLFETTPSVLTGPSRAKHVCDARHVAMALIRAHTELSWPQIGRTFSRDKCTVINAVRTVLDAPMRRAWAHAVEVAMTEEKHPQEDQ